VTVFGFGENTQIAISIYNHAVSQERAHAALNDLNKDFKKKVHKIHGFWDGTIGTTAKPYIHAGFQSSKDPRYVNTCRSVPTAEE
jgi:hypothetical protein